MSKIYLFIAIVVLGLGGSLYFIFNGEHASRVLMAKPQIFGGAAHGFSVAYPETMLATKHEEDEGVSLSITGAAQKAESELSNGLTIDITRSALKGKTLSAIVEAELAKWRDQGGQIVAGPLLANLAGATGQMFEATDLGHSTVYLVPASATDYLKLELSVPELENNDYLEIAKQILESLKIL